SQPEGGPTGFEDMSELMPAEPLIAARESTGKFIARVVPIGGAFTEHDADELASVGGGLVSGLASSLRAVNAVAGWVASRAAQEPTRVVQPDLVDLFNSAADALPPGPSGGLNALKFAEAIGLPVVEWQGCQSVDQALEFAEKVGYAVV